MRDRSQVEEIEDRETERFIEGHGLKIERPATLAEVGGKDGIAAIEAVVTPPRQCPLGCEPSSDCWGCDRYPPE